MLWNNSMSLTWLVFGYILWGWWNMATAAFFRDFKAWNWCSLFPHRHCYFPASLNPPSCFRDDVQGFFFSFAKGPRRPQRWINTIHVFTSHWSFSLISHHWVHLWMCRLLVLVLYFLTSIGSGLSLAHGEATLASSYFTGPFSLGCSCFYCNILLHSTRAVSVNNVKPHSAHVFFFPAVKKTSNQHHVQKYKYLSQNRNVWNDCHC